MFSFLCLLLLPSSSLAETPTQGLVVRDPIYYDVLPKNSKVSCRYMRDASFGLVLERGAGNEVKVTQVSNGVNEGDKTAFTAEIVKNTFDVIALRHYSRSADAGQFHEIAITKRRSAEFLYGLPAMISSVSAMYSKDEDGKEKEDLYADGFFRISCAAPLPGR